MKQILFLMKVIHFNIKYLRTMTFFSYLIDSLLNSAIASHNIQTQYAVTARMPDPISARCISISADALIEGKNFVVYRFCPRSFPLYCHYFSFLCKYTSIHSASATGQLFSDKITCRQKNSPPLLMPFFAQVVIFRL